MPYVLCHTDHSACWKEPLKVTTEYAYTEALARALFEICVAENVIKGWGKVP